MVWLNVGLSLIQNTYCLRSIFTHKTDPSKTRASFPLCSYLEGDPRYIVIYVLGDFHLTRALKSREERTVTPAMGAAMMGPMYSLRENGAQHGGRGFHLRLSTL